MPYDSPLSLDPELRRQTRGSHLSLFVVACVLTLPALAVFFGLTVTLEYVGQRTMTVEDGVMMCSAGLSSMLGVLAWAALGLLLTKATDPKWHATTWVLVSVFGLVALPSSLVWMCLLPDGVGWLMTPILAAAVASLAYGWRNLKMARQSLRRQRPPGMSA